MDVEDEISLISDSGVDIEYMDSDMASISSSVYEHRYGKRRYHGFVNNPYPLPNDEDEKDRLDRLHFCLRRFIGGNVVVPISKHPTQIVDLGTGSGAWVIEVANDYPSARVIGIDLSPVQPIMVPINAEFIVADFNDGLDFNPGSTDLVNSRCVGGGTRQYQWDPYLKEILRILKPGSGYAQFIQPTHPHIASENNTLPSDAPLNKLWKYIEEVFIIEENLMLDGKNLERYIRKAGFIDIHVKVVKCEIGDWGPDSRKHHFARILQKVLVDTMCTNVELDKMKRYFTNDEERNDFAQAVRQDILNLDYQLYLDLYVVIGRKPSVDVSKRK